jgi:hypothetical protein
MRTRSRLLLAGLAAALLLSAAVTSTHARDLSISNQGIRIVWSRVRMGSTSGINVECPLTLEGRFHSSTVHKTIGALVGFVTRGTVVPGSCTGGRTTINQEALPWHVRYNGFSGTLPTITLVFLRLIGSKFTVESGGSTCITQSTAANPSGGRAIVGVGGGVTELVADETVRIPLRGAFFCSFVGEAIFEGSARVMLLGNTTIVSIRLI